MNARNLRLPIDIQCDMFEKVVFPILLYGSEEWGFNCTVDDRELSYMWENKSTLDSNIIMYEYNFRTY